MSFGVGLSALAPDDDVSAELAPCVKALMARLPDKDREAIEMVEFEGLSQKAMSEKLDMSFSGAKSRVQRARGKMKDLLEECCSFEINRHGSILEYEPKSQAPNGCCGDKNDCPDNQSEK